ncbi:hypothetical protein [Bradyrhizobium sp. sBnM-33]|uniref:hypothetical protein n=1 Tax=Bradyrhizobium sp. sBnM-33 TaxID=2831780 RepID=UPI001BCED751|nr:hypothetical protein [Bradyrhizobium sp. sBnM-33]WOH52416.1 hypothetical protein RX328_09625 [Bradyrhizobium sp. sBnM-33]
MATGRPTTSIIATQSAPTTPLSSCATAHLPTTSAIIVSIRTTRADLKGFRGFRSYRNIVQIQVNKAAVKLGYFVDKIEGAKSLRRRRDQAFRRIRKNQPTVGFASMKASLADAALFDTEVYITYFLAAFKSVKTGKVLRLEKSDRCVLDRKKLRQVLDEYCTVGFNSIPFDIPIVSAALAGFSNKALKQIANEIIQEDAKALGNLARLRFSIDRVRSRRPDRDRARAEQPQDLQRQNTRQAHARSARVRRCRADARRDGRRIGLLRQRPCRHRPLMQTLKEQLTLREQMTKQYGVDLRSKSDAQVAEAVIKKELKRLTGEEPKKPKITPGKHYKYRVPDFIHYRSTELNAVLGNVRAADFAISTSGKVIMPDVLKKAKIKIGSSIYRVGIGGLHSSEKTIAHRADAHTRIVDRDVRGYYPQIILNLGLYPQHLGPIFLRVFRSSVERRNKAKDRVDELKKLIKRANDEATLLKQELKTNDNVSGSLKIVNNGAFGKLGSKWSVLFAPDLMIQVTIGGQLSLLMLIEMVERAGFRVVSANTDGIVIICPTDE